jgi:hypothetical protein
MYDIKGEDKVRINTTFFWTTGRMELSSFWNLPVTQSLLSHPNYAIINMMTLLLCSPVFKAIMVILAPLLRPLYTIYSALYWNNIQKSWQPDRSLPKISNLLNSLRHEGHLFYYLSPWVKIYFGYIQLIWDFHFAWEVNC